LAIDYEISATGKALHESDAPIKLIIGPYGSGKSTAVAHDILYYAMAQPPGPDGCRRSRWGVVRASYPNLVETTRKIVMDSFPEGSGQITSGSAPLRGTFSFSLGDGSTVCCETQLWALADFGAVGKIKSLNWTGVWINEATEVSEEVFVEVMGRTARFPDPAYSYYHGVLMDSNKPPLGSWVDRLSKTPALEFDGVRREIATFFQPPAVFKSHDEFGKPKYLLNEKAENLSHLQGGSGYYAQQVAAWLSQGRTDVVDALFAMLDVDTRHGRPVFPMFDMKKHAAPSEIRPLRGLPVVVGLDTSGIHLAAVFFQFRDGKWCLIDELYGDDLGFESFIQGAVVPLLRTKYFGCEPLFSVDPADARDSFTGLSPSSYLARCGFRIYVPPTNKPVLRIAAVSSRLEMDRGGLMISPHCEMAVAAMRGAPDKSGYHYKKKRLRGAVDGTYAESPEKNEASHIADAIQYAVLYIVHGAGHSSDRRGLERKLARHNERCRRPILS
jgi:hypothetical protein